MTRSVALATAILLGTAASAAVPPVPTRVEATAMSVRGVGLMQGSHVVLLETASDKRLLPIFIGPTEAEAINLRLSHIKPPRPMTTDLLETLLETLGGKVERIEVDDLRDNTFFGKLTLKDAAGKTHRIDARPSDLISLAVSNHLPIHVAPHVLQQASLDGATLPR